MKLHGWMRRLGPPICFARSRDGGVLILLGVMIIPLIAMVGLALDSSRAYLAKARLSNAVDAAALAGGRAFGKDYQDSDVEKYFAANFPESFMGATVAPLVITPDYSNESIAVEASATIDTSFMRLLGFDDLTVTARSVVRGAKIGMEVVLVMDNTGSMLSDDRIGAMKQAARDLVETLYDGNEIVEDFWVGLVPYTATVNIGDARTAWLTGYTASDYGPSAWKGCVEARAAPRDQDDSPPSTARWQPHLWASTDGDYGATGDNDWPPIDETNEAYNEGTGPNLGCGPAITPLTAEKTKVLAAIDEMLPWHRGGTMANLGLVWGWRALSPRWRGLWDGDTPDELPLDYDTPGMDKVVVLLTDGVNQWYDWPDGLPGEPDAASYPDADYTAYGRLSENRLGTTDPDNATTEINTRMAGLCAAMKQQDIRIYTIVFQVNDAPTETLYRNCATSEDMYFSAPSNEELQTVFKKIASELLRLRIAE